MAQSPTVLVGPLPGHESQGARQALMDALAKSGRVNLLGDAVYERFATNLKPESKQDRKDVYQKAKQAFEAGKAAYAELEFDAAKAAFSEAKLGFRRILSDAKAFDALRASQFNLAMTQMDMGDVALAKSELEEVLRLDPERMQRPLSESLYSPKIRNLFKTVQAQVEALPKGQVMVETDPKRAMVYLDGQALGLSPVTSPVVPIGEHFLTVEKEGVLSRQESIYIGEGMNDVRWALSPKSGEDIFVHFVPHDPRSGDMSNVRLAFLDQMGTKLGVDVFVFLKPGHGKVLAQLFDQRSHELSWVELGSSPGELTDKLLMNLNLDGYVYKRDRPDAPSVPSATVERPPGPDPEASKLAGNPTSERSEFKAPKGSKSSSKQLSSKPLLKRPILWIVVGGVLAAGAGAYFATGGFSSGKSFHNVDVRLP